MIKFFVVLFLTVSSPSFSSPFLYVVGLDDSSVPSPVQVIDIATNKTVATFNVGKFSTDIAINPAGTKAYITNFGENTISIIDIATNTVTTTFSNPHPLSIVISPDGTKAYVTNLITKDNATNRVSVIDTATNVVTATIKLEQEPAHIAINPAGTEVYVSMSSGSGVPVINTNSNSVIATMNISAPTGVIFNSTGTTAYIASMGALGAFAISVIDTATHTVIDNVHLNPGAQALAMNPSGTQIYIPDSNSGSTISIFDTATKTVKSSAIYTGPSPRQIVTDPIGNKAYVTVSGGFGRGLGSIAVIDMTTNTITSTIKTGMQYPSIAITPKVASAVSIYDGIYQLNPNMGYVTFSEKNGTMIAVVNQTYGGYSWGAANGTLNGSSVQLSTILGTLNETVNVNFTSATTFTATMVSCSPNTAGYYCLFSAGQKFTGTKIW